MISAEQDSRNKATMILAEGWFKSAAKPDQTDFSTEHKKKRQAVRDLNYSLPLTLDQAHKVVDIMTKDFQIRVK